VIYGGQWDIAIVDIDLTVKAKEAALASREQLLGVVKVG